MSGASTSVASVDEHVLITKAGFEPVGDVTGTSIHHVGIQFAAWRRSLEVTTPSRSMHNGRELTIERMRLPTDTLHADGAVGADR